MFDEGRYVICICFSPLVSWIDRHGYQETCRGAFTNYVCIVGLVGGQKNAKFTT